MSVSLGQVAFAIGLVNSVLNLSIDGQVKLFEEFKFWKKYGQSHSTFCGLV